MAAKRTLDPKVRAERRRCLRLVEAFAFSYELLRNEAGVVGETARARIDMARKIAGAIRQGARS
jgi:hypothetical protein